MKATGHIFLLLVLLTLWGQLQSKCVQPTTATTTPPGGEKPGICPGPRYIQPKDSSSFCDKFCTSDENCPGNKKCCDEGCEKVCKPPAADKPGDCPARPTAVSSENCTEECTSDSECAGTLKCCFDTCGRKCLPPPGEAPGFCPPNVLPPGIGATICLVNCTNCTEEEKCCPKGCSSVCTRVSPDKPGSCAINPINCFRGTRALCTRDSGCPGDEKCCSHQCGMDCVPPLPDSSSNPNSN
ncbi:WAP four-disulfide core domain protein 3 [Rhinatrema bivittatum]|uniref:WAP four-disulfide core domain protein 3 n=1 Tax=Rhinatrema bivittatum TaxID=194408 RepID=UPI0011271164|nr:WAP four-disulfide core domain protein 3 [Rhinatrema bivittatum]